TIDELTIAKTQLYGKAEVAAELQNAHVATSAINTVGEFLGDEQPAFRNFVVEVDQPGLGRVRQAGDPYILSKTPWRLDRGAPGLDEHRDQARVYWSRPATRGSATNVSLDGIRVITFPTGVVGPCLGRLLGDHGAEVIAIEAKEKP